MSDLLRFRIHNAKESWDVGDGIFEKIEIAAIIASAALLTLMKSVLHKNSGVGR